MQKLHHSVTKGFVTSNIWLPKNDRYKTFWQKSVTKHYLYSFRVLQNFNASV